MKKKIIGIRAGRNIDLTQYGLIAANINRIWTIYDEEEMWNYCKFNPETGMKVDRNNMDSLKPFHHHGVFLEQKIHDWNVNEKNNLLHYGSRVVEQGENIKILVEYEEIMDKNKLKVGDVIRFHDWGVGGRLFGIIVEQEDDLYHSKLNIWRPKDIYFLQAHGIDNIELIQSFDGLNEYDQRKLQEIIKKAQDKNMKINISIY